MVSMSHQQVYSNCLLNFTATTVQQPGAKLPYSKAKQRGIFISGLPNGLQLKHPSSYGCRQLKSILDNKINLIHGLFHMCRFEFMSSSTFIYTVPDVTYKSTMITLILTSMTNHCLMSMTF